MATLARLPLLRPRDLGVWKALDLVQSQMLIEKSVAPRFLIQGQRKHMFSVVEQTQEDYVDANFSFGVSMEVQTQLGADIPGLCLVG